MALESKKILKVKKRRQSAIWSSTVIDMLVYARWVQEKEWNHPLALLELGSGMWGWTGSKSQNKYCEAEYLSDWMSEWESVVKIF